MADPILEVKGLSVVAGRFQGAPIVDDVTFDVGAGRCLGIVGESGSGKSMTMRAIMGIAPARIVAGTVTAGTTAMVFQDAMTALNPSMRVGELVAEGLRAQSVPKSKARVQALELLAEVGVPDPRRRAQSWPHELSGGLRQRVMIAMALSVQPQILLCDEPTTALDVTIQDQVLSLLERLRAERKLAMVFVSHDLAVISRIADQTAVMYSGSFVETGSTSDILARPRHPYTSSLLAAAPDAKRSKGPLTAIPGLPPRVDARPSGCVFGPRCSLAEDACMESRPPLAHTAPLHESACRRQDVLARAVQ